MYPETQLVKLDKIQTFQKGTHQQWNKSFYAKNKHNINESSLKNAKNPTQAKNLWSQERSIWDHYWTEKDYLTRSNFPVIAKNKFNFELARVSGRDPTNAVGIPTLGKAILLCLWSLPSFRLSMSGRLGSEQEQVRICRRTGFCWNIYWRRHNACLHKMLVSSMVMEKVKFQRVRKIGVHDMHINLEPFPFANCYLRSNI